ncbi:Unannotated [Lentimonas sp. CC19]|nr:Unannotated [Lentimonas sp. CC4]CAA6685494.1 Unannotated [Lentimonas sp. CC6]CAA6690522.1 Unannotated [Lentimonas sp. CC10]CAA6693277.1 Unannotated [Lentimonas sp. CC19]CAA7068779.1 Unannotated [Lentimonas sp. CC11]CAA7170493.1 Unannotated [Lentimonas sp. CC21]CAA7179811.1 Unannotated [Lentimonas sp. CC8]
MEQGVNQIYIFYFLPPLGWPLDVTAPSMPFHYFRYDLKSHSSRYIKKDRII